MQRLTPMTKKEKLTALTPAVIIAFPRIGRRFYTHFILPRIPLYFCADTPDKVLQISSPENPNLSLLKFVFALVVVALVAIGCGSDSGGGGGGGGCFISAIDGNQIL